VKCEVCSVPIRSTANAGEDDEEHYAPITNGKKKKGVEAIRSVNMQHLGENFV
jgi:hypothetical protein